MSLIHRFPDTVSFDATAGFTNPFRYVPHPLVKEAAGLVMERLDKAISEELLPDNVCRGFKEGKMIGVLVCRLPGDGNIGYLAAFSGSVGGQSCIDGFVPPVFNLLEPSGHFKCRESEITEVNKEIIALEHSNELESLRATLSDAESDRDMETEVFRQQMSESKARRQKLRMKCNDNDILTRLTRESQHEKAELRRLKQSWERKISEIRGRLDCILSRISHLKNLRGEMSEELQQWIFRQYIVHNASGASSSILDIFTSEGLVPPGGTGDCAAPKLLEYAFLNDLQPLAMGEFWYGLSPDTAVRTHGHFYPSCTSKCGPLLGYMLQGLRLEDSPEGTECPVIIYEDESVVAVDKPAGMPSVPGLDGRISLHEWLTERYGGGIHPVHRLDMDTSGIMIFARNEASAVDLRRQFEEHKTKKTYHARLIASSTGQLRKVGERGRIELPLSPDYDERPRQKVDRTGGKPAVTEYEVRAANPDRTMDVIFHPVTGRTHQLRVHSAHHLGLGCPIKGDRLYGGALETGRLHLHAFRISFSHPRTGEHVTLESPISHI